MVRLSSERYRDLFFFIPMQDDLSFLIEDAKVHRPCVQINAAIKFVLIGVKSHTRPPLEKFWVLNHT